MHEELTSLLNAQAGHFMSEYLKLKNAPQLIFVDQPDENECILNDSYEPGNALYFNIAFLANVPPAFALLMVLHEIYHYCIQGITTHASVVLLRDQGLWPFMQWYDVEADLQVVMYLCGKQLGYTFAAYLQTLFQGVRVFRDKKMRLPKFERFIASIISIKAFFDTGVKVAYLVKLSQEQLTLISADFGSLNLAYKELELCQADRLQWQRVYQDASQMRETEYVGLTTALADSLLLSKQQTQPKASMKRQPILKLLANYAGCDEAERAMVNLTIEFIQSHPNCFEREQLSGHVTGSAWIVNAAYTHVLLIHHFKLDRWFQPGGHCDGDPDVLNVALKEAGEETGLVVTATSPRIFDVDIHEIPERQGVPAHLHYDIRFLLTADTGQAPVMNQRETRDIKWVPLREVVKLNATEAIMRMVRKTFKLIPHLT